MKNTVLDEADIRILSALQRHGALSKSRLAEMVNLSQTPCWARLDRLKKAGLIRGYHADIALNLLTNVTQVVVTLSLNSHGKSDFDRFEAAIRARDAITSCIATGGGMDYVMQVVTPNLTAFQELMDGLLTAELGIGRYMTYIVTREIKSSHPNLSALLSGKPS